MMLRMAMAVKARSLRIIQKYKAGRALTDWCQTPSSRYIQSIQKQGNWT